MQRIIIVVLSLLMPGAMAARKNIHLLQDLKQTQSLQEKNEDFTEVERRLHSGASLGVNISEMHTQTKVPLRKLLVAFGAASVAAHTPHAAPGHQPLAHVRPRQHGGGMEPATINRSSTPLTNVLRYGGGDVLLKNMSGTPNAENMFDLDGHLDLEGGVLSQERLDHSGRVYSRGGIMRKLYLTDSEEAEFYSRFGPVTLSEHLPKSKRGKHDDNMELFYDNPDKDADTALYLYTSSHGDHDGAFAMDGPLAFRLLQMSVGHNVAFKRVSSVEKAHEYMEQNQEKFGKIAHLVLGGHGNQDTLRLGNDDVRSIHTEVHSVSVEELLEPIKHLLELDGEHRSRVFLDSCSTGEGLENFDELSPDAGDLNLAMKVAQTLPGAKVYAFDKPAGRILLNPAFYRDGDFKVQSALSADQDEWLHPFVIQYSTEEELGRFHVERSLLQTETLELTSLVADGTISQPDDGMGEIRQGLTQEECEAACAEQHGAARMFLSMQAATMLELADTAEPGVCVLFATQESLTALASVVGTHAVPPLEVQ